MHRSARNTKLSARLDQLLTSYAMAARAAGVALLACSVPADARVVCGKATVPLVGNVTIPFNPAKLKFPSFNLAQTYPFPAFGTTWNRAFFTPNTKGASDLLASNSLPRDLAAGAVIGPKGRFGKGNSYGLLFTYGNYRGGTVSHHNGNFPFGKVGYLGYKFSISGKDHFGWARLRVDIQTPHTVTKLLAFGYETVPGKPVHAGSCTAADESASNSSSAETLPHSTIIAGPMNGSIFEGPRDKQMMTGLGVLALGAKRAPRL